MYNINTKRKIKLYCGITYNWASLSARRRVDAHLE